MFDRVKHTTPVQKKEEPGTVSLPKMTLTVEQMASELNISRPTAYTLIKEEGFPALNIGHRVLVNRAGLQRWLDMKSGSTMPSNAFNS